MSKMKIYHTVKGGGEVVTEDSVDKVSVPMRVKQIQSEGGFWTDTTFIPWASITYIEFEKAPGDVPAVKAPVVAARPAFVPPARPVVPPVPPRPVAAPAKPVK